LSYYRLTGLSQVCAHLDAESVEFENKLDGKDAGEDHVEVVEHVRVDATLTVELLNNTHTHTHTHTHTRGCTTRT